MNKYEVEAPEVTGPAIGHYSEGLRVEHLFFSGMAGTRADGTTADSVYEQTKQIFANVDALLKKAGGNLSNIVNVTVYLTDLEDFMEMNRAYKECITRRPLPARATVQVAALLENFKVEMVITAYIP